MADQNDFELFFDLIPDLACIVSKDGYFKRINRAWETTLGYTREEILSTPMLDFIHPDDLETTRAEVAKQGLQYRTSHFVNRYRCRNGSYRILNWRTTFTRDDSTRALDASHTPAGDLLSCAVITPITRLTSA